MTMRRWGQYTFTQILFMVVQASGTLPSTHVTTLGPFAKLARGFSRVNTTSLVTVGMTLLLFSLYIHLAPTMLLAAKVATIVRCFLGGIGVRRNRYGTNEIEFWLVGAKEVGETDAGGRAQRRI